MVIVIASTTTMMTILMIIVATGANQARLSHCSLKSRRLFSAFQCFSVLFGAFGAFQYFSVHFSAMHQMRELRLQCKRRYLLHCSAPLQCSAINCKNEGYPVEHCPTIILLYTLVLGTIYTDNFGKHGKKSIK